MDSEDGASKDGAPPSDPFANYHHRKPSISTDIEFSLDSAIGDAFKAVLGTTSEVPEEEAIEDDSEFNFEDTIGNAFRKVIAEAKHASAEPEEGEYIEYKEYSEEKEEENFDLDSAIGAAFKDLESENHANKEEYDFNTHGNFHDSDNFQDQDDLQKVDNFHDSVDYQTQVDYKDDGDYNKEESYHEDDLEKSDTLPKDVYSKQNDISKSEQIEENDEELDLQAVIGNAFVSVSKAEEDKEVDIHQEAVTGDASGELGHQSSETSSKQRELIPVPTNDDDLATAIGDAFKSFPGLADAKEATSVAPSSPTSPRTRSASPPATVVEPEDELKSVISNSLASVLPDRRESVDISSVIGNALKDAIGEKHTSSTSDNDLEEAIGNALSMLSGSKEEDDLDDAIGDAFKTVLGGERSHATTDVELEQAISDALRMAGRTSTAPTDDLESIISDALASVLDERKPRRDSIIHVATVMRQTLDETEVDTTQMNSIIENAFNMAMSRRDDTSPELSELVSNLTARLTTKRGEREARERELVTASLKVAQHYVEGSDLEGAATLLGNLLQDHSPEAINANVPWVNPSFISTITNQVLSTLSVQCHVTESIMEDKKRGGHKWQQENQTHCLDMELKQRVGRRANTFYGADDSPEKLQWIEEEFTRRREKRHVRNKPLRGHDKEMIESLTQNPTLITPVTNLFDMSLTLLSEITSESITACSLATATAAALYAHDHEVVDIKLISNAVGHILNDVIEAGDYRDRLHELRTQVHIIPYFPGDPPPSPSDNSLATMFYDVARQIQGLADNVSRKRVRSSDGSISKRKRDSHYPTLALPASSPFISNKLDSGSSSQGVAPPKPFGGLRKPGSFQRPQPKMKRSFSPLF